MGASGGMPGKVGSLQRDREKASEKHAWGSAQLPRGMAGSERCWGRESGQWRWPSPQVMGSKVVGILSCPPTSALSPWESASGGNRELERRWTFSRESSVKSGHEFLPHLIWNFPSHGHGFIASQPTAPSSSQVIGLPFTLQTSLSPTPSASPPSHQDLSVLPPRSI